VETLAEKSERSTLYVIVFFNMYCIIYVCVCVCVCVCVWGHVYVVYEDTHLYNDMGMT